MEQKAKGLIVLSGGMDSVTLLHEYKEDIALAVSFDYGSKHNAQELKMAAYHCAALKIPRVVIPLGFMNAHFKSALLTTGGEIPDGRYAEENMKSTVVPFRNGIMLAIAAGLAESRGLEKVYIANHFGDHAIYPDCRRSFIDPMVAAVRAGTTNMVEIQAPYTDISKTEIACRGGAIGVDYSHTYSCYKGRERHCGSCATCLERKEAFREAGLEDPTDYEA